MSLTATAYFLPRIEIEVCFSVTASGQSRSSNRGVVCDVVGVDGGVTDRATDRAMIVSNRRSRYRDSREAQAKEKVGDDADIDENNTR